MSKEEHNKTAKVENLIWEIVQTLQPNSIIQPEKIEKIKKDLLKTFDS